MPYYFSDNQENISPYLYRDNGYNPTPFAITVLLPDIFLKDLQQPVTQGPFCLSRNSDSPVLPYKIDISKDSDLWQFSGESVRQTIIDDFIQFFIALEKAGLKPGALNLIRQCLSQAIPATFAETLYFRYGLYGSVKRRYVDLQPGQRLRIDYQEFQLTGLPENHVNGYVGNGSMYYDMTACRDVDGNPVVGFSPFLYTLMPYNPVQPNRGGSGGVIDLLCHEPQLQYWRLLYPDKMLSSDEPGFAGTQKNITLVGSPTFKNLEAATNSFFNSGKVDTLSTFATFFRGRAMAVPEILFYLRGIPQYLPLGTTVRQIINHHIQISLNNVLIPNFKYQRSLLKHSPHADDRPEVGFPDYEAVNFSGQNYRSYWNGTDSFDLPVLGGDALTFSIPDAF